MKEKVKFIALKLHPKHVSAIFDTFLKDESIGGKLILFAAVLSLIVVNSPLENAFNQFWHTNLSLGLGSWGLSLDLRHWVNEGLMAFFFLVVGLEIKREFVKGELKNRSTAILPIGAAIGGMIFPALIYLVFNINTDAIKGWGIPIATDIAFAVAVISLLSKRVPVALKVFLLTLAIADDIGAIFVIALFYAEIINYWYLAVSVILLFSIFLFRKKLTYHTLLVSMFGILLWLTTHLSGIHASIVGAAMGFLAPIGVSDTKRSAAERAEKFFLPITTFFILPVFAFANAGFKIESNSFNANPSIFWGIFFGLIVGKSIGITLVTWILVKLKISKLPTGMVWKHIIGIGCIAGIGFTVSIFITELAFYDKISYMNTSKLGIFIASATSALAGYIILKNAGRKVNR